MFFSAIVNTNRYQLPYVATGAGKYGDHKFLMISDIVPNMNCGTMPALNIKIIT